MLRCGDRSLYTGIATDIVARLKKHQAGKGAAYTRSHLPVRLVYIEGYYTQSEALKREAALKRLSKIQKQTLVRAAKGR